MKSLAPISPPHIDRFRLIVSNKKAAETKRRLEAVIGAVSSRYSDFEKAITKKSMHKFAEDASLQSLEEDLRSCYAIGTAGLGEILDGIKNVQQERQLEKCPYCGITLPTTHDHYLPASKFPELAVHGLNLVPCCSSCNEKKGGRWKNGSARLFLHYYSDSIPDEHFLVTTLCPTPNKKSLGVKFSIRRPDGFPAGEWALIESHFERLDLLNRYREAANDEIANALDICVDHLCEGGKDATAFLGRAARRFAAIFGEGHWRTSLYTELARSRAFVDMVKSKAIAEGNGP